MHITKSKFKQIIKEEYSRLLNEIRPGMATAHDVPEYQPPEQTSAEAAARHKAFGKTPWGKLVGGWGTAIKGAEKHWPKVEAAVEPVASWWLDYFGDPQTETIGKGAAAVDKYGRIAYETLGGPQTQGLTRQEQWLKTMGGRGLDAYAQLFPQGQETGEETWGPADKIRGMITRGQWDLDQQAAAADIAIGALGGGLTTSQVANARRLARSVAARGGNADAIVQAAKAGSQHAQRFEIPKKLRRKYQKDAAKAEKAKMKALGRDRPVPPEVRKAFDDIERAETMRRERWFGDRRPGEGVPHPKGLRRSPRRKGEQTTGPTKTRKPQRDDRAVIWGPDSPEMQQIRDWWARDLMGK